MPFLSLLSSWNAMFFSENFRIILCFSSFIFPQLLLNACVSASVSISGKIWGIKSKDTAWFKVRNILYLYIYYILYYILYSIYRYIYYIYILYSNIDILDRNFLFLKGCLLEVFCYLTWSKDLILQRWEWQIILMPFIVFLSSLFY